MDYQTLLQLAGWAALGLAGLWLLMSALGSLPAMALWKATVEPVDTETARESLQLVLGGGKLSGEWAAGVGLKPKGVYEVRSRMMSPLMVGWRHESERTYLVAYLINGQPVNYDLVSILQGGAALTTGTAADGQLFPVAPDNAIQTFDVYSLEGLWEKHREGLEHLASTRNRRMETTPGDLVEDFLTALREQEAFIGSIPLWQLRVPYWYFTRRGSRHNKTLAQLGF